MHEEPPVRSDNWRQSYAHVFELSALGLAWEFVRRNPKLRDEWSALKPAWKESIGDHGTRIVREPKTERLVSPYLWTSSPEDATAASVIWNPMLTRRVLRVVAVPPRLALGGQTLDLEYLSVEKTLMIGVDGSQQLLLRDGPHSLQLDIRGASISEPATLFLDTALPEEGADIEIALLRCFHELRSTGGLLRQSFPPHPYAKRAALVLTALDGYLASVSHREIAVAVFGPQRVERDWGDPGEHLRDAVRRAIARGVALMEHGYSSLLR